MASVTIKDLDDDDLHHVAAKAKAIGVSTQEYLRRLIARDAAVPALPDELAELARIRQETRRPMTMKEFASARRRALRA